MQQSIRQGPVMHLMLIEAQSKSYSGRRVSSGALEGRNAARGSTAAHRGALEIEAVKQLCPCSTDDLADDI